LLFPICKSCPFQDKCPTIKKKNSRVFYFNREYYLSSKRRKTIETIPVERRKLRNNIEATMKEFVHKMPNRKLKVRGYFKTSTFAFTVSIAINFGRIYRLLLVNPSLYRSLSLYFARYVKDQLRICIKYLFKITKYLFCNKKHRKVYNFTPNLVILEP